MASLEMTTDIKLKVLYVGSRVHDVLEGPQEGCMQYLVETDPAPLIPLLENSEFAGYLQGGDVRCNNVITFPKGCNVEHVINMVLEKQ